MSFPIIEIMRYNFQNNINAKLSNSSKLSLRLNVQLRDMTTPNQGVGAIFNNAMNTSPVEFPVYFPDDGETPYIKYRTCQRRLSDQPGGSGCYRLQQRIPKHSHCSTGI